ncbi:hypothetical protein DQW50_15005 [Halorubrum sp. 48-1-W]|uniref:hypothetical protein n=1 Tax=Halorubrum sp. 48-1-W TaxID=2249761 RepID=UPI000DCDBB83|nr:hypothetical protein [Halorubrum sp. 48-1-W]RAW44300.1 hypothetical protein DQW50_15005 [Halorubrum sp. 48-1-W]
MSVAGLCQLCENALARHTCRYCGRQVCRDHWNETVGACTACAEAVGGDTDGDTPDSFDDDHPDGSRLD